MKKWFQEKILNMAILSEDLQRIGLAIIFAVTVYDIFRLGWLGFRDYGISYRGIILIWLGVGLIVMSKKADKYVNGGKK